MKAPPAPRVPHPVMYHEWNWISFLHWRYQPAEVDRLVPAGLQVETFDGSAWVGLTPFRMEGVRAPDAPSTWCSALHSPNRNATNWPTS